MKNIGIYILVAAVAISGAILFLSRSGNNPGASGNDISPNNVVTTEGKQIIEISAKGGYFPRATTAKANTPTVLRIKTSGTFDCSSALSIPSLNYRKNLPASGETLVEVPPQAPGSILRGTCAMGMYNFAINFE